MTGFIATSVQWKETLQNVFSNEVKGIDCVISTNTESYTFTIQEGDAVLQGKGDLHNAAYDRYRQGTVLTAGYDDFYPIASTTYTLNLYPNQEFMDIYSTKNPEIAAIGAFAIIMFTSIMFALYDCLVQRNINKNQSLLQAKRQFVRYVSHEVRTPLNTVCMGLKLLQEEIRCLFSTSNVNDVMHTSNTVTAEPMEPSTGKERSMMMIDLGSERVHRNAVMDLTHDVLSSANAAVG